MLASALSAAAASALPVELTTITDLVEYLRAGDVRLVRPSPSAATAARQREPSVIELLPAVLQELVDTNATSLCDCDDAAEQSSHATAAEALHLLTTDNPSNRELIGVFLSLLNDGAAVRAP